MRRIKTPHSPDPPITLIYSETLEQHIQHVRAVLQRLREVKLYAKLEKCEFHTTSTAFLGYIITPDGISMDQEKITAILEWPTPRTVKQVQAFLGFANFYRRFIKDFSFKSRGLTRLTRKDQKFLWDDTAQLSFEQLKESFTNETLLRHFDPARPILLETDASDFAIGAVLSQKFDNGLTHPVAFYSRKMLPAETNYEIHDKELLAIVDAFKEWRQYLEGAEHQIEVITDHQALQYFTTSKKLNQRQARWHEFLVGFNYRVTYRPGKKAVVPDALSRRSDHWQDRASLPPITMFTSDQLPATNSGTFTISNPLLEQLAAAQQEDPQTVALGTLPKAPFHTNTSGLILHNNQVVVPNLHDLRLRIMQDNHDSLLAGHPGRRSTLLLIQQRYWWPNMRKDIEHFVESCETCRRNKATRHKKYGQLQPLPAPFRPWTSISMDFVGELPESNGHNAILVIVDRLTKMALFIPSSTTLTSEQLASTYLEHVFSKHGLPSEIVSDRGSTFVSGFWRSLAKALNIDLKFSTAYHPETNGQTERVNQSLAQYLRMFVNHLQTDWATLLPMAEFAYNNTPHSTTGTSPFFANKGYHPQFTADHSRDLSVVGPAAPFVAKLKDLHNHLQHEITKAGQKAQEQQDRKTLPAPVYTPGERVWLSTENLKLQRPTRKFDHRFIGPFKIIKFIPPHQYQLDLPSHLRIHDTFNVKLLERYVENTIPHRVPPPPPPIEVEGDMEYEIEEVLDIRKDNRRKNPWQYLIKWVGYGPEHNSWEPIDALDNAQGAITAFHNAYPAKPRPPLRRA